jgi:hypothetical protein
LICRAGSLFTGYSHVDLFWGATLPFNQQIGVSLLLASLSTLNWRPIVDLEIRSTERKKRMQRLAELNAKLSAISCSSATNSSPTDPTPNESEM